MWELLKHILFFTDGGIMLLGFLIYGVLLVVSAIVVNIMSGIKPKRRRVYNFRLNLIAAISTMAYISLIGWFTYTEIISVITK